MIIHQVVREGYGTFQGDNGFHKSRIFSIIVISILFSVFGKEIQKSFSRTYLFLLFFFVVFFLF